MITRRSFLAASTALAAGLADKPAAVAQQRNLGSNRLVLLGTRGGPRVTARLAAWLEPSNFDEAGRQGTPLARC